MHQVATVELALTLIKEGHNDCEVSSLIGVPRSTIRGWRAGRTPHRVRRLCDLCAGRNPDIPPAEYAYLLGMYLGDGCISQHARTLRLRVVLDESYPAIVQECASAMKAVCPENRVWIGRHGPGCNEVAMYWSHWTCVLPQHGEGKKHHREIVLAPWQDTLLEGHSRELVKGLIHSDGCRVVADDRGVQSVRYHFSNRSEDIKAIFCAHLDALGIPWTRPCDKQIAIYRKGATAVLDEFIGPKR